MILSPKTSLCGTSQLRDIYGYALCEVASMYTLKLGLMMDCKSRRTRGWDRSCDCSCTLCLSQMSPHAVLLMLLTRKGAPVKRMNPEMISHDHA